MAPTFEKHRAGRGRRGGDHHAQSPRAPEQPDRGHARRAAASARASTRRTLDPRSDPYPAELLSTARNLAERLASGPTQGFARTKQAIYVAERHALDAQLDLERDLQRELGRTRDYLEGVSAFIEKRPPVFKGE